MTKKAPKKAFFNINMVLKLCFGKQNVRINSEIFENCLFLYYLMQCFLKLEEKLVFNMGLKAVSCDKRE